MLIVSAVFCMLGSCKASKVFVLMLGVEFGRWSAFHSKDLLTANLVPLDGSIKVFMRKFFQFFL